ncbi:Uncharacterised protein [Yersinia intermedia]|jgi:hypothetical protein|uniref:Uncharacterized protein n=1 Tax=Yersinia intermedia TaxID=631 RepID=A0ABX6F7L1_YERIN|nr:hypothetical protein [Yersinia intermedia]MCB5314905.1 hypothetical protein [Yersinia intermedia]MCB5322708.1 hypothetical protein [Yersinia intermedia]MCB5328883.1 hypothetical protein [Yersinia intermedia]OVZ77959.1 hypothetical protein CBW55_01085 [Yersinia intermedia]QGR64840.1 hypothetical protein FOC38_02050 [Yersinia intermedia]
MILAKKYSISILAFALVLFSVPTFAKVANSSDDHVKQMIINESIESYPGNCPCPFNSASNGSSCGKRSAWSRAGGYSPICYKKEVTKEMVAEWRESNKA